ncbi:MAG: type I-E CRISPR-associated protein Cas6/Cse3/CasE [Deltaproteobacteria bacterium]|nr:type I-E CRISPR-associated protein Cas6/Cse3/CasE [Deltaproteobacteria bacterium]
MAGSARGRLRFRGSTRGRGDDGGALEWRWEVVRGVVFDGTLVVLDVDRFRTEALERGLGPAKAYGFGLMSIARAIG